MIRECVAALIVRQGKILLGKRSATRPFYPDIWDVFGGHVQADETLENALYRELFEELGITPTEYQFLLTVDEPHPLENGAGRFHIYLVTDFKGVPHNLQPEEHALIDWFGYEAVLKLPLPDPLYIKLIGKILGYENLR